METISHDAIEAAIQRALPDAEVRIQGDDGEHFMAMVVSESFDGMPLVRQHQAVLNALKSEFDSERLHALQLKTFTPEKWQAFQAASGSSPLSVV